ncbi:MAG: DUF2089 family protein [Anaerolineales bacterium]
MLSQPEKCPLCGGELTITRMHCRECDTTLDGRFVPGVHPFAALNEEQLRFVEVFVRNEGKLKHMEGEMNLSYPTLRNRLHEIIRAMGYEPGQGEEEDSSQGLDAAARRSILDALEAGEISYDEAMQRLTGAD